MRLYITLTNHCINQIKERNPEHARGRKPEFWAKHIFTEFITKWKWKGRKVRYSYTKDWKYRITDWKHQFIYAKPYKIEYVLITYVKKKFSLDLRPKEKFIKKNN